MKSRTARYLNPNARGAVTQRFSNNATSGQKKCPPVKVTGEHLMENP